MLLILIKNVFFALNYGLVRANEPKTDLEQEPVKNNPNTTIWPSVFFCAESAVFTIVRH